MGLYKAFIKASPKIKDPQERGRAEITAALMLFRQVMLLSMLPVSIQYGTESVIYFSSATNLITYPLSRSRYFAWAGMYIIVEILYSVPTSVVSSYATPTPTPHISV